MTTGLNTGAKTGLDLAGQAVARLCHDLLNPLGALGNGLELMDLAGVARGPEASLMGEALSGATARLRFLRRAFGPEGASAARADLAALCEARFQGTRLSLDWSGAPEVLTGYELRLIFLLIMCLQSSLPQGGTIAVVPGQLTAHGPRVVDLPDLWSLLAASGLPRDIPSSRDVHFALAAALLQQRGQVLHPAFTANRVEIQLPD